MSDQTKDYEIGIIFYFLCPRDEESGGILIYPCLSVLPSVCPFVRPDIDTWFVQLSSPTVLELQL